MKPDKVDYYLNKRKERDSRTAHEPGQTGGADQKPNRSPGSEEQTRPKTKSPVGKPSPRAGPAETPRLSPVSPVSPVAEELGRAGPERYGAPHNNIPHHPALPFFLPPGPPSYYGPAPEPEPLWRRPPPEFPDWRLAGETVAAWPAWQRPQVVATTSCIPTANQTNVLTQKSLLENSILNLWRKQWR